MSAWKSSQLQHRQRVDPDRQGSGGGAARIGSGEERGRVSEGLEAGASETLRLSDARLGRGDPGQVWRSAGRRRRARRAPRPPRASTPASWPRRPRRPRPSQASGRRPPAVPEPRPLPAPTSSRTFSRPRGRRARRAAGRGPRRGGPAGGPDEDVHAGAGRPGRRRRVRIPAGAREAPVAPRHPRRHQPARKARPDPAHAARHRAALRRRQGARRRPHETFGAELVGNQTDAPADEAPAAAQEAPRPGRVPRRGGETRALGRRAPEGPADRGPVQGAGRDHERAAGEPARGGDSRARPDRGAVRRGGGRPGAALRAGPGARERLTGGSRRSSVVESVGERW